MIRTTHTTTLLRNGLKLRSQEGTIGNAHDPYGWKCTYAELRPPLAAAGASAAWYSDGLGQNRVDLCDADGRVVRRVEWHDAQMYNPKTDYIGLKARILFRRHIGIDPQDAENALYEAARVANGL